MFWTQGANVSQRSFAPPKPCFAPVQLSFAPVQEDFGALGPKDLLHPLLTTLGTFEVSGPRSRTFGSQDSFEKHLFFVENRPSQKRDSSEDWTRITRISMRIGDKTRFARIWPSASKKGIFFCESIRADLRNVGVRIACPLRHWGWSSDSL